MLDGDGPNIDNFLPFSLREVAIARGFLNGNKTKKLKFLPNHFFLFSDTQSVTTHPTIGGDTNSLSNSVAHLVDDRSNESTKALPGTGAVSLCESLLPSNRYEVNTKEEF
jgi:hypothetical protein